MTPLSHTPTELDYLGETSARPVHVAMLLTLLCPGVGYMYVGRLIKGITINFLFVLLIELFIILMTALKFFPLLPLGVLVCAWLVFAALCALDVRDIILEEDIQQEYLLKPYNHWLIYVLVGALTGAAPVLASAQLTERHLITLVTVRHGGMYPNILPGDVVLVDRLAIPPKGPMHGDLVAVSAEKPGAPTHILRVVALQDDIVRVEGDMLFLDEEPLERTTYEEADAARHAHPGMFVMMEQNHQARYLISMARRSLSNASVSPLRVERERVYLLLDNRSQAPLGERQGKLRDSRNFGQLKLETLRGKPRHILWSSDPETGLTRWDRIGLRLDGAKAP